MVIKTTWKKQKQKHFMVCKRFLRVPARTQSKAFVTTLEDFLFTWKIMLVALDTGFDVWKWKWADLQRKLMNCCCVIMSKTCGSQQYMYAGFFYRVHVINTWSKEYVSVCSNVWKLVFDAINRRKQFPDSERYNGKLSEADLSQQV